MTTQPTTTEDSAMTVTDAPTTDVATYDPSGGTQAVVIGQHVQQFVDFAKTLAVSDLLPDGLRGKPGNVFMALMQGLDLGLRPMQALQLIDVIKGKPCIKAEGMRALIVSAGHEIRVVEMTDEKCVIEGRRKGTDEWVQASFTAAQAQTAGLSGDNWKKYRPDMLLARASTRLAKAYFADVINGLSSSEELLDVAPAVDRPTLAQIAANRDAPAADAEIVDAVIDEEAEDEKTRQAVLAAAGEACPACGEKPYHGPADCPMADDLDSAADAADEAQQAFEATSDDGS